MQESIEAIRTELEQRLSFETLMAEISTRFINVPADRIDSEIEAAQRHICESLDIDLLAVWQLSNEDPVALRAAHYYSVRQGPQPPGLLKQEDFPWFLKQLVAGRIVAVSSLEEMPAEAAHDREVCRQIGVKSNLSIPLSVGGGPLIGVLGFNTTRAEREWPDALVRQLQLIGQIFTNALARRRTEQTLRQKNEELDQFFNISLDLLCIANTDALNFLQGDVGDLFTYVPIISVLANPNVLHSDPRRHVVAQPVSVDPVSTVKEIVTLKTDTRRLFVVSGSAAVDRRLEGMVKARLQGWGGRPDIEYVSGLPMAALLKKLSHLPPESAVLYITVYADSEGKTYQPAGAARLISASSNAPVFGLFDTLLGHNGIVGASLLDQRATIYGRSG